MGLFTNPLGYAGYPPGVTAPSTVVNSTVRAATLAEAEAGTLQDVYISPYTMAQGDAPEFASPPPIGSMTPNTGKFTTLEVTTAGTSLILDEGVNASTGTTTGTKIGTATTQKLGFFNATPIVQPATTTDIKVALVNLGLLASGTSPLNLGTGAFTCGTLSATGTANINTSGAAVSSIGTGGTGAVNIGNATGNTAVTGSLTASTTLTATAGAITATNGNLVMGTAGNKIIVPTGSNASAGTSGVMSGTPGAVTVATTACSATAKVFYSRATTGGTMGNVSITAQDGTGFTLTSTGNETSTFNWWIINA